MDATRELTPGYPRKPEVLTRYRVVFTSHTGRLLRRQVATFKGPHKAVALATQLIVTELGTDPSVSPAEVRVDDLGPVGLSRSGIYDLAPEDAVDREEL